MTVILTMVPTRSSVIAWRGSIVVIILMIILLLIIVVVALLLLIIIIVAVLLVVVVVLLVVRLSWCLIGLRVAIIELVNGTHITTCLGCN
jgi:hypothetical protein